MNSPGVHPRNLFESSVVSHLPVFPIVFCFDRCTEQELHEFSWRDLLLRHRFWRISRFCLRFGTHRLSQSRWQFNRSTKRLVVFGNVLYAVKIRKWKHTTHVTLASPVTHCYAWLHCLMTWGLIWDCLADRNIQIFSQPLLKHRPCRFTWVMQLYLEETMLCRLINCSITTYIFCTNTVPRGIPRHVEWKPSTARNHATFRRDCYRKT